MVSKLYYVEVDGRKITIIGDHPDTCFASPTVFEDVSPDMAIAKEEIFGPVMSIMRAKDLDAAIELIDANPYGNGASIFTSYGKAARESEYRVKAGNIGINVGVVAPMAFFAMQKIWKINIRRVK